MMILSSLFFVPVFAARESVQVTRLANPVTIDGKWTTTDEWSDTSRIPMYLVQGPPSTGYVRLKHDDQFLYLLVDFVSDTSMASAQTVQTGSNYDALNVGIDTNVNDTNTKCCDVMISLRWYNGKPAPEPIQPPWVQGAMSYDGTNDPDSSQSHAIYEITIPMGTFENSSALRISVWDWSRGVNMHWPQFQGSWSMAYFGDLVFSQVVVPEFPLGTTALLTFVVLATVLITKRDSRSKIKS